jgi:hypothetical protein
VVVGEELLELIHMHGTAFGEDIFCEMIYKKKKSI